MKYVKSILDLINEGQIILCNNLKEEEEKKIIVSIYDVVEKPKYSKSVPSWGYLEYPGCKYWH